jgi:hypothetical protein
VLEPVTAGPTRSVRTAVDGRFEIAFVAPGEYLLRVEMLGFTPLVARHVIVRAERTLNLELELTPAVAPFEVIDTVTVSAGVAKNRASTAEQLWGEGWHASPAAGRDLAELLRTATLLAPLPGEGRAYGLHSASVHIDGFALRTLTRAGPQLLPPLTGLSRAELVAGPVDVEIGGSAGSAILAHSLRGGNRFRGDAQATASGGGLIEDSDFTADPASPSALRGEARLSGPIIGDSAHFAAILEIDRSTLPLRTEFGAAEQATLWRDAIAARGGDLERFTGVNAVRRDRVKALGRLDWQISEGHDLTVLGFFAQEPEAQIGPRLERYALPPVAGDGRGFAAFTGLTSQFSGGLTNEVRVGIQAAQVEAAAIETNGEAAFLVPLGAGFGSEPVPQGRSAGRAINIAETLHVRRGAHHLKTGVFFESARHERDELPSAEFVFGGVAGFGAGTGAFQSVARVITPDFTVRRTGVFAQHRWTPALGLDVLMGARFELEQLPSDLFAPEAEWIRLSGFEELTLQRDIRKLSPRTGFVWDVQGRGEWVVNGGVGLYHDPFPLELIADIVGRGRGVLVRRGVGEDIAWPNGPAPAAIRSATTLTLPAAALDAPRTTRATLGVTRALGRSTTLSASAVTAETEFMPRRRDVNLDAQPLASDQYGRPILGELVQQGELIAARPGSSRRFSEYDVVEVVETEGTASHWALSFGLERLVAERLRFLARYTYSETTDDVFLAREAGSVGAIAPILPAQQSDWLRATSDFDVPHRLAFAAIATVPVGSIEAEAAIVYRRRSGLPFTPSLRPGVDVAGTGSMLPQPVYLDDALAGVGDLVARWSCLRDQLGRWVERNACRAPDLETLDVRLSLGIGGVAGGSAAFVIEGTGLVNGVFGPLDTALYRIDPEGQLVEETGGTIRIPYIANPGFGEPVLRRSAARVLRLGIQLRY